MSNYIIEGVLLSKGHPQFSEYVEQAYKVKERPMCACVPGGTPMYIAKTSDGSFLIKRMPNSGHLHHPDCDSFEIPSELSGRGDIENKAVMEDHETGLTNLKLDFSLSKMASNRTVSKGESAEKSTVSANPTKLSIRSLLHLLYEEASLNKWSPKMASKRNWYVVRKYLLEAASNKVTRNSPLTDALLIPEIFSVDRKDEILVRLKTFMGKLKPDNHKRPMGLLIGELKGIEPARFGHKMIIKHMPETPFYMGEDVYKRINKAFSTELSFWEEMDVHLIVIATFMLSPSGNPSIDTISFMAVDRNWLPFETLEDLELIERCIESRHFIKGLRYNLKSTNVIASILLTDTQPTPTAVYITPAGAKEDYIQEQKRVIDNSELDSYVWDIDEEEVLLLPEPQQSQTFKEKT